MDAVVIALVVAWVVKTLTHQGVHQHVQNVLVNAQVRVVTIVSVVALAHAMVRVRRYAPVGARQRARIHV